MSLSKFLILMVMLNENSKLGKNKTCPPILVSAQVIENQITSSKLLFILKKFKISFSDIEAEFQS